MVYILILLIGLIFVLINYLIIKRKENFINSKNIISNNIDLTLNYKSNMFNELEDDVKEELEKIYGINNSELLVKHNNNSKKYMLVDF